ncbi:hypothetical protein P9J64_17070 [Deltaproteobacteria bacterium IMCC39524]|nr:hypothetical protein [Deltaproteobacteria bacterium IMCC39524]
MSNKFFRIVRTPSSEAYGIMDEHEDVIGRFDLHYSDDGKIDAVVTVQAQMTQYQELELVQKIDLDLIENAEIGDGNFSVTFFIATSSRMYGKEAS